MTVFRGGKADRVPLTIYDWILEAALPGKGNPFEKQGLTLIGVESLFKDRPDDTITIDQKEIGSGKDRQIITTIETPAGQVTERAGFDPFFGSKWIKEHFIKSLEDYKVMQYFYDHTTTEPKFEGFVAAHKKMGQRGIIVGGIHPIPVAWLMLEIMGTETWCEGVMLHIDEYNALQESLTRIYKRRLEIAADSPAEVVWYAESLTGTIVSPSLFNKYCKPIYDYGSKILKQVGKLTFSHYDGTNLPLKDCIASVDIDIIEAFTPPPMEQMTVAQARAAWPDKVLSINFPGTLFSESSKVIEKYVCEYMEQGGNEGKFVVGCTEEFDFSRFEHTFSAIVKAMERYQAAS
ncbi:MAG: hypothetical protein JSV82_05910 [Planctomycetota bacterium]|nr:MAG: hypothetical protein JSV82_05910 [Planctomycetota bacterium]